MQEQRCLAAPGSSTQEHQAVPLLTRPLVKLFKIIRPTDNGLGSSGVLW
jgi:hypothetical protein